MKYEFVLTPRRVAIETPAQQAAWDLAMHTLAALMLEALSSHPEEDHHSQVEQVARQTA